jgi:transposase
MSDIKENNNLPRKWLSAEQKLRIVNESHESGKLVAEVARKYNVGVSSLIKWRQLAEVGSLMSVKNQEQLVPMTELKKLQQENKQLQRLLGKKSLQIELLKEAIEIAREKKLISRQPLPGVDDIVSD